MLLESYQLDLAISCLFRSRHDKARTTKVVKLYYSKAITKEGNMCSSQKTHIILRKTISWNLLSDNAIIHS